MQSYLRPLPHPTYDSSHSLQPCQFCFQFLKTKWCILVGTRIFDGRVTITISTVKSSRFSLSFYFCLKPHTLSTHIPQVLYANIPYIRFYSLALLPKMDPTTITTPTHTPNPNHQETPQTQPNPTSTHPPQNLKDPFPLHDLKISYVPPPPPALTLCGALPGDHFYLRGEMLSFPPDRVISLYSLSCILPLLPAKQRMLHGNDWMGSDALVGCADPNCRGVWRIERVGVRWFGHGECTVVGLEGN